jgi:hypothetical protein
MMAANRKTPNRNYLSKDFADFRRDLLGYARTFFPDKIQDFSEASVGGLLLDMAATVGDNMSFYLDHQFRELSWSEAVEVQNIERLLRNNGVKITGASPSTVTLTFYIEVPAVDNLGVAVPDESSLPVILPDTVVASSNGVFFSTVAPVDFTEKDRAGNLMSNIVVGDTSNDGTPLTFILSKNTTAVSGKIYTESFTFGSGYRPFQTISLSNENVTEVMSVVDSDGNLWYEVESLTQDTVFLGNRNRTPDRDEVEESLYIVPAPLRFITTVDLQSRSMQLRFGGGDQNAVDDDVFPDPSKFSLPTYGRNTIPRFTVDPNALLRSKTLGVAPTSTTLTVNYRAGGGISHNVGAGTIRSIKTLNMEFRDGPASSIATAVRASVDVVNNTPATGGAQAPTIDQLRTLVPAAKNAQARIVTKSDLISRVYSLPSKFGKVFRAGVRPNPNNPLASQLFVLSTDSNGRLIQTPDTLKQNLRTYLNEYRLISDAIDIVDARVINVTLQVTIVPTANAVPLNVSRDVIQALRTLMSTSSTQIDQAIVISDVLNSIINVQGVLAVTNISVQSISGLLDGRQYSENYFDVEANTYRGLIVPPPGAIFEVRFPQYDIVVTTE